MVSLGTQPAIERAGLVTPRLPVRALKIYPDAVERLPTFPELNARQLAQRIEVEGTAPSGSL